MKKLIELSVHVAVGLLLVVLIFTNFYELGKLSNLEPPTNYFVSIALTNAVLFIIIKTIILLLLLFITGVVTYSKYKLYIAEEQQLSEVRRLKALLQSKLDREAEDKLRNSRPEKVKTYNTLTNLANMPEDVVSKFGNELFETPNTLEGLMNCMSLGNVNRLTFISKCEIYLITLTGAEHSIFKQIIEAYRKVTCDFTSKLARRVSRTQLETELNPALDLTNPLLDKFMSLFSYKGLADVDQD